MASKMFDLGVVTPERPTVRGFDGKEHTVKLPDDFGITDFAKLKRLRNEMVNDLDKLSDLDEGPAAELEENIDEFMSMIVPGLTEGDFDKMTFAHKYKLVEWWTAKAEEAGKAQAGQTEATPPQNTPSPN